MKKILSAAMAFIMCASSALSVSAYYDAVSRANEDPTESIIEFEAEDFKYSDGFVVTEDFNASGGKVLKSTAKDAVAEIDLKFEKPVEKMVMYAYHKGANKESNLSYIYINNMDGEPMYTTNYNTIEPIRVWYGNAFGNYKIHIRSERPGHMVDKVVIKYKTRSESVDLSGEFLPGNPEAENLDLPEVKETALGSYLFDVENGKFNPETSTVVEDADASGGKYFYSDEKLVEAPKSREEISLSFKFKVNKKGKYNFWLRYNNPVQKAGWYGIDNTGYVNSNAAASVGWVWKNMKTFNLDEGWHTLDIQGGAIPGQQIDCIILTNQTWYSPIGKGALPGEQIKPDSVLEEAREAALKATRIWVNGVRNRTDAPVEFVNGNLTLPFTNMDMGLGLERTEKDGYIMLSRGRNYVKFHPDSKMAIVNGKKMSMGMLPKPIGGTYMVPLSIFKSAFGFDWEYDEIMNCLYIFDSYEENAREAKEGEIIGLENLKRDISIKIPYDNPDVKIRVFARQNDEDRTGFGKQNWFDSFKDLSTGGYDYKFSAVGWGFHWYADTWVECPEPYYKDGAFYTRRADIRDDHDSSTIPFDVMVSIIDNGKEDLFIARNLDCVKGFEKIQTVEEFKTDAGINTNGELLAESTFENIGFYIDYEIGKVKSCKVEYRKVGDEEWKKAHTPQNDTKTGQFRGSIVKLEEGTEYEIKAVLYSETGSIVSQKLTTVKTKTTDVPIAKTIKLSEIYDGEGPLQLQNVCGTEDGWIKIDCEGQTIDGSLNDLEGIYISECHYLILENAVVLGGRRSGISVVNESTNIHIRNCDISDWGPGDGVYDPYLGLYFVNGYVGNYMAGVHLLNGVEDILVERCYIHDANLRSNPWRRPDGKDNHPCGSSGFFVGARGGIVIRYNDVIGSDKHRFNDCIEGFLNSQLIESSVRKNSDIYGNMFYCGQDDIMELDGPMMNTRVYENRMEQTLCGISTARTTVGPAYLFNNLITNLGTEQNTDRVGAAIKMGGTGPDGYSGKVFMFNNTLDNDGMRGPYNSNGVWPTEMKNNFVNASDGKQTAVANSQAKNDMELFDIDYNLIIGPVKFGKKTENIEHNILFTKKDKLPQFENKSIYDFNLPANHPGVNAGQWLDGFSEHYVTDGVPDIGAFEKGNALKMIPNRPIDIWADKYRVDIANGSSATVTFHIGDVPAGQKYKLDKNKDYTWFEILSPVTGELTPNTDITVKIKADLTGYEFDEGNGMLMLRTEEGFSVPVTIYAYYPQ